MVCWCALLSPRAQCRVCRIGAMAEDAQDETFLPRDHDQHVSHLPLSLLLSLCFVPSEVVADVLLAAPFESMVSFGAACGVATDAGWRALPGDSVWYVWAEAMVRDLPSDVETFARDVLATYRLGRPLPLPQQCTSLFALYRTVVQEVRYIQTSDRSHEVGGRANLVLCSAVPGPQLTAFKVALSVTWVGFAPNLGITSIGRNVLSDFASLTSVDLHGLRSVTTLGSRFLYGCRRLTTIDLSPLSNITAVGNGFLDCCELMYIATPTSGPRCLKEAVCAKMTPF